MSERRQERVLGPYEQRGRGTWRVVVVGVDGRRRRRVFATARQAGRYADLVRTEQAAATLTTVAGALDEYRGHLEAKGNRESSITTTMHRLRAFFCDGEMPLKRVTTEWCSARYSELRAATAVDTHRNVLAEAKTLARWLVKRGWLGANPLERIEGLGRRRRGKAQLRIDEAGRWLDCAMVHAGRREPGAVAALLTALLGLRCSEVVGLTVRDVDDGGCVVWVSESKTEAGRRRVRVPDLLRPHLLALADDRDPGEPLLGVHWRDWPRLWVQRLCREAKVPVVTAHGMRGLLATLAYEAGDPSEAVARLLGHASPAITQAAYARAEAVEGARQRAGLQVLRGGRR